MEKQELDLVIREAMRAELANGARAHHHCWKRRLAFTIAVAGGLMYLSHVIHVNELERSWEFVAACVVDKLVFGIAEA
ncbi:hypothetical protein [Candidimonas nitroreducens]|uniref:Uncharacterized protein n=1 Tax=Candidimonas nitroreducens TaxID=683354 RepID=A0A225M1N3_9BURK|nr:hypothetical protein [Candidimonas nitroreducens]OWT55254.1 hypothetical protein CEY11_21325 [Candidimonas nitroreducens]